MTPEEVAKCGNQFKIESWLLSASVEDICKFLPHVSKDSHDFEFAKIALNIRITKSAERTNRILVWLTVGVFILTAFIVLLALLPVLALSPK